MIDDIFLAADVTTCPELLGVRLRPLSIWHSWALRSIDSPFVQGGEYDVDQICQAVLICSLTRAEYAAAGLEGLTVELGKIGSHWLTSSDEDRETVLDNFIAYIDACSQFPDFWRDGDADPIRDRLRCPAEWHLVASLTNMGMCTESEAWDYPIARAQCWQAVEGERAGSRAYVDQRDRADFAKLNEAK